MEGWIILGSIGLMLVGGIMAMFSDSNKTIIIGALTYLIGVGLFVLSMFASTRCEKQAWEREETPYVTHTIIALSDGNEVDGKFRGGRYCTSGYINEKFTYVYGYETVGGGMKIQKAGSDIAVVYFRDDIEPCAEWYKETKTFWWCTEERKTCDIYIPTDSLEASITIDLE